MRAREILWSTHRVLSGLAAFGQSTSPIVVAKSGDLLRRNKRFPRGWPLSSYVFPITSEDGKQVYATTIVFNGYGGKINLELSHCTCEAGHAGIVCHHYLSALVKIDHLGYRLET